MLSGSSDWTISLWNIWSHSLKNTFRHEAPVAVLTKLDNDLFASGGGLGRGSLKIWNYLKGNLVHNLEGHSQQITSVIYLGSNFLVSGTTYSYVKKDTIKVWNISNGSLRHTFNEKNGRGVNDLISLGSDNRLIVTGLDNNHPYENIKIWNVEENS